MKSRFLDMTVAIDRDINSYKSIATILKNDIVSYGDKILTQFQPQEVKRF